MCNVNTATLNAIAFNLAVTDAGIVFSNYLKNMLHEAVNENDNESVALYMQMLACLQQNYIALHGVKAEHFTF